MLKRASVQLLHGQMNLDVCASAFYDKAVNIGLYEWQLIRNDNDHSKDHIMDGTSKDDLMDSLPKDDFMTIIG